MPDLLRVKRIAIFRALQFGDLLCSVPALRAIRRSAIQARITLIGLPWAREWAKRHCGHIDDFLEFPGFPGLPEREVDHTALSSFFQAARDARFDLAIQMHGSGAIVNSLLVLFGASENAGYFLPGEYCPDPKNFMPYPQDGHEINRHLSLAKFLGARPDSPELEFLVDAHDHYQLEASAEIGEISRTPYICLHPGARYASRRWPARYFSAVGDALAQQGLRTVITGSDSEKELARTVAAGMRAPSTNLAGRTSLGALGALVSKARLVITNDTGMSHLAAALKTPSVVLVLSSDEQRWAPLDRSRHRVLATGIPCRPCEYRNCPIGFPCSEEISPAAVIAEALAHLSGSPGPSEPDIMQPCSSEGDRTNHSHSFAFI
jgi:ADP-heptose:LPS heptosyltransferase